jgi:hypothetical protein
VRYPIQCYDLHTLINPTSTAFLIVRHKVSIKRTCKKCVGTLPSNLEKFSENIKELEVFFNFCYNSA